MKKETFKIFIGNTSGNITAFVGSPMDPRFKAYYGTKIMEQVGKQINETIEQVGFITPSYEGAPLRLDMMGGEFCANAYRAYGYYIAEYEETKGEKTIEVYGSGTKGPVYVDVNMDKKIASIELPKVQNIHQMEFEGNEYNLVEFEGILHGVIFNKTADKIFAKDFIKKMAENHKARAYGAMFYDMDSKTLEPYVYVPRAKTFMEEKSCGSGSSAVAIVLNNSLKDPNFNIDIKNPGGVLNIKTKLYDDNLSYFLSGPVELSPIKDYTIEISEEDLKEIRKKYKSKNA